MMAPKEADQQLQLRALAARAVTDSLRLRAAAAASRSSSAADRFRECVRSLEAEKAKMEVFRRELPISVHLVADVIEWLKEEIAQQQNQQHHHRRPPPPEDYLFPPAAAEAEPGAAAAATPAPPPPPPAVKAEADANDKRSWMSSAQLWTHDDSTADTNAAHKVSGGAFMPTLASLPTTLARSTDDVGKPGAKPVTDLSLSSPAAAAASPSASSSAVTDAAGAQAQRQQHHQQAQAQQRKARRCWSPELHRRFVAALQRLGGAQVATPKQIRELMKVDGLTNDEVKSHLQKYRLHTRRASSDGGGGGDHLWSPAAAPEQQPQYATSQHSTSQSQSGSPQGPLHLATVSSRATTTAGDSSCDAGDEAEGGKSESYGGGGGGWEAQAQRQRQRHGTKASSSS